MNVDAFPPVRSMETSGSGCGLTCREEINLHKDTVGAAWPVLLLQLSSRADVPHQGSARPGPTPRASREAAFPPAALSPLLGSSGPERPRPFALSSLTGGRRARLRSRAAAFLPGSSGSVVCFGGSGTARAWQQLPRWSLPC